MVAGGGASVIYADTVSITADSAYICHIEEDDCLLSSKHAVL